MTNFAKLGEFTAYSEQAYNAAYCRYALMHNLSQTLMRLRDDINSPFTENSLQAELESIVRADREMRAALAQANEAAALCGKPPLHLHDLTRARKG
ncbi:hypothetical protein HU47_24945 [Salmonella enterica subsp. enterica serovar Abaetetuba]|uniref:hypothetical protein n=1 Tax=Salmonella enterica TaxID=28901 RepID=UPI000B48C3EC|nr:hypothetical protein [Salmonella enterica]EAU5127288.1 hypothetical protein [Salmonella enterica subsp. enterica serovar Infantis]EBP4090050.1 hypothetical protein [Salmonella enterica subsp. enterica]EBV5808025.1 hypothetical protein [Salmonella enterica subsp. enterica serovar Abaetetuba]ECI1616804.1 hypothetical protein [Salmonella enterica subsp. enterica serovar Give]EDA1627762.1 hypothetical protein [Salmonella enterica subsp. enterica serovar Saintpaul]EDL1762278.1 hypothetical prot